MPRPSEKETDKIVIVIKQTDDPAMPVGHHSPIYVETVNDKREMEYFYDAYDKKCYVSYYMKVGNIEVR